MPYIEVLQKYADFDGRATRTEYWLWILIHVIILVALTLVFSLLFGDLGVIIPLIYILATIIPHVAVSVRRLHDIGRSGLWYLLSFVPFGGIVILIFHMLGSDDNNEYGPRPV